MRFSKTSRICYTIALIAQILCWKMGIAPDWGDALVPHFILVAYAWAYRE